MRNTNENIRILRVLSYRRVSTREQGVAGTSLDAQKTEIETYCAAHRLPAPIDFVEIESGGEESEEKRTEVMRLLAGIRPGDAVITSKIDRFARDMVFIVKHVRAIRKRGACFISLAEGFDSRRPESEMMLGAWAMAADMERRRIQERTQGPRKLLRAQGKYVEGMVPFGYEKAKDGSRRLVIQPEQANIIKEMYQLAANGWSSIRIRRHLATQYPEAKSGFAYSWVVKALHNPVYMGKISKTPVRPSGYQGACPLPGEWIDAHEPIISPDLFAIVQNAIRTRLPGRKPKGESLTATFLMRAIARCSLCQSVVASVMPTGYHLTGYYACNSRLCGARSARQCKGAPYLRQDATDAYLIAEVGTYLKAIKKSLARPPAQIRRPDFDKRRADIRKKRDNVVRLVAEGLITFEATANTLREIEAELSTVDAADAEFKASLTQDTAQNRKGALAFVEQVSDEWDALTVDVRRNVLAGLAREITLGKEKHPRIVWKEAGELAVDYAVGALPELRVPVIQALPAPRTTVSDLLGTAQREPAGAVK